MNALENSLCASCEHLISCHLTSDKSFIYSCSEYAASKIKKVAIQLKDPTGTHGLLSTDTPLSLV